LEVLRQLGQVAKSQDVLLQIVRDNLSSKSHYTSANQEPPVVPDDTGDTPDRRDTTHLDSAPSYDWFVVPPDTASPASTVVAQSAAFRWLGVLTSDPSDGARDPILAGNLDSAFLGGNVIPANSTLTPLQRATIAVDDDTTDQDDEAVNVPWKSMDNIDLLSSEQALFSRFLRQLCSWVSTGHSIVIPY
jgi:hypothetical protein